MTYLHIPGVAVQAWFTQENGVSYRHRLEVTRVDAARHPLTVCVVMQNPSYANEHIADKSVQFIERNIFERELPEFEGVERLIVVNQFARVQTNGFVGLPADIGAENDAAIEDAIDQASVVVLAWGVGNPFNERQEMVLGLLRGTPGKTLYRTRSHPSRGRYDGFILPFDA